VAIINNGETSDAEYAEYARRRLGAFLQAARIDAAAICIVEQNGQIHLAAVLNVVEEEDVANIPKKVDRLRVEVI
jgi:hypothetical protein